ncbi:hypothetical protein ABIA32_006249 [Streptacidiphilus sp. MAP12-20]|uniref:hypothetical protein n=1 Tax=Streptacidiphilus sp. MAP12-20 TaxID=3156299 RepID=UPI003510E936
MAKPPYRSRHGLVYRTCTSLGALLLEAAGVATGLALVFSHACIECSVPTNTPASVNVPSVVGFYGVPALVVAWALWRRRWEVVAVNGLVVLWVVLATP